MGNTLQAGIKKDDHGGSCNQQPPAASVAPDQLRAGVKGDGHGGSREQQPQATCVAPDQLRAGVKGDDHGGCSHDQQFQGGAADRARNQLQPLGGGHDVETTSMLKNCMENSATNGGGGSGRIEIIRPDIESLTLRHDDDPPHPSLSEPDGVEFVLHTLPVKKRCIGDGDGFTAYVKDAGVAASGSYKVGDTSNRARQRYRIRMRGIDAPELKMEYGEQSRNELQKLIGGKCLKIDVYGTDQFDRYLGDIYCDGVFIQEIMLKKGFAWYFRTGEKRPDLERWEKEAKEARLGLWLSDNPQKPWEWKRDHPRNKNKESANDIQVESQSQGNYSIETLPWLISKDMETLGREWKKKLEKFLADNMELNNHLHELKRNKKEAEDQAKKLEKEMESVVADNKKLNDQLEESKKNKKKAEDRILKLTFLSESAVAVNMGLHDKLEKLKEKNKKAEDRTMESEKEMASVVAVNMELNDQLQELKGKKKVAEDRAAELKLSYASVTAVNMDLQDTLEELRENNRKAEDRAMESKKEMERVVADNMKLNGQVQRLNNKVSNSARNSKKKLQNIMVVNMDLNAKLEELLKKNEKAKDQAGEPEKKETENVVHEEGNSQGIVSHEKSEQAIETPLAASPAKVSNSARNSKKKLQTAIDINIGLSAKIQELQKNNEKAEDGDEEPHKETENVVPAGERDLQGIIRQEKSEQAVGTPSAAPPAKVSNSARNSKKKLQTVMAVNADLNAKLQELLKNNEKAKNQAEEPEKKETENVVAEEGNSQGVVSHEKSEQAVETPSAASPAKVLNSARKSKKKLQTVIAVNIDLSAKIQELQKNNEKVEDKDEEPHKETPLGDVVTTAERDLQGIIRQEKSEQAVETPLAAPPAKDSAGAVWRKKTAAATS